MVRVSALDEKQLLKAAASGDRSAFSELVKRYEETVYRFSLKMCRDPAHAEEVLQDTFINVFRKLRSFDGKSKFTTWLYTIVTNNCLMKRRKRKLDELEDSLEELDNPATDDEGRYARRVARWDETPADLMLKRELRSVLDDAILKLPDLYRAVFVLRDVEGNSTEETAQILGISMEATKSRLRRARAFLRDQLDPYMRTRGGG